MSQKARYLPATLLPVLVALAFVWAGPSTARDSVAGASAWMPAGPSHKVTIWAVGDGADVGRASYDVSALLKSRRLNRFLYLGDVYEYGTATDFALNYVPLFGRFASRTAPTPGNHEWPHRYDGYYPYWSSVRGSPPPDYYAFSIGGWQLLSLNSEADHGLQSPQLAWLRRKISRTPKFGNCRLAFWHRPRFSGGPHGNQPDVDPLWQAVRRKARLTLHGNDHNYQRFRTRDGVVEVIAGTGGRSVYPVDRKPALLAATYDVFGALRLRIHNGLAELAFVSRGGAVLDHKGVRCHHRGASAAFGR
jgi:hypothetical protein